MSFLRSRWWVSLGAWVLLATPACAGFVVRDLGTLANGGSSQGMAINGSGLIAGTLNLDAFHDRAFLSGSSPVDLGTLPGGRTSAGFGINSAGLVTGDSEIKVDGQFRTHAFRSQGSGALLDMGVLPGDVNSAGRAINTAGHVAGWSTAADGSTRAMIAYAPNTISAMAGLGGVNSKAFAINDSDVIAGEAQTNGGFTRAFRASVGGGAVDLGTLAGSTGSSARGINNNNDVVGFTTGATSHAFLSLGVGGPMMDLGLLPFANSSAAWGLNDARQVVGQVNYAFGNTSAFLWLPDTQVMSDLNTLISPDSGWQLLSATGINGSSQITGYGIFQNEIHAFRLDPLLGQPLDAPPSFVPEPGTAILSLIGGLSLLAWRLPKRIRSVVNQRRMTIRPHACG